MSPSTATEIQHPYSAWPWQPEYQHNLLIHEQAACQEKPQEWAAARNRDRSLCRNVYAPQAQWFLSVLAEKVVRAQVSRKASAEYPARALSTAWRAWAEKHTAIPWQSVLSGSVQGFCRGCSCNDAIR